MEFSKKRGELLLQEVIFFFDDSGVLHKNEASGYFVYAGYVFSSREELEIAKRKYIHTNKEIKKALNRSDELKAASLNSKHRRALFNAVREFDSVSIVAEIENVNVHVLEDKNSICRYKDQMIKHCVNNKLHEMVKYGNIDINEDIKISIFIDEQLHTSTGYYSLRDLIIEEVRYGIKNLDYGTVHPTLFNSDVDVRLQYCDSSKNYLIQASDILANRIWTSFRTKNENLRQIKNHLHLTM